MIARAPRVSLLLPAALLVACGPDGGGGTTPDAGTPVDAGPGFDGVYDSPDDFNPAGCSGGLADLDPLGIWHMEIDFESGAAAVPGGLAHDGAHAYTVADVLRIDAGEGGELEGYLFGSAANRVSHTATSLFVRRAYEGSDGSEIVRAWNACGLQADGSLFGRYANCRGEVCLVGTFEAHALAPLDEDVASGITETAVYGSDWPVDAVEGQITVNVQASGGLAVLARYYDGLRIVDVSNPSSPVELGHSPVADPNGEFYNDVKLIGDYAMAASSARGAVVIDVSDPSNPNEVTAVPDGGADVHSIFIDGSVAYLANLSTGGIDIYDVTDPSAPQRVGSYVDEGVETGNDFVHDLYVADGRAYLNYWNLGLVVVDVSDPASPQRVGAYDGYEPRTSHANWVTQAGGRLVSVHGDEGFNAHVRIVDVDEASGSFLEEIGSYQTRPQVSVHNLVAEGDTAFVTYYQDGLRVLDLADPANPVEIAHYQTWPGAEPGYGLTFFEGAIGVDFDADSGRIYVADTHRGLVILELE